MHLKEALAKNKLKQFADERGKQYLLADFTKRHGTLIAAGGFPDFNC
jgi:hypothetical protein